MDPHRRFEAVNGRYQVAECVVPRAALVAIERLVVTGIDLAAKVAPTRDRKADWDFLRIIVEGDEARARKVLALVEF